MNRRIKIYRNILIGCTGMFLCILFLFIYYDASERVPERLNLISGKEQKLNLAVPVTGEIGDTRIPKEKIHMNFGRVTTVNSGEENHYQMKCRLFGMIPLKTVEVAVIKGEKLQPAGIPVGIYMNTNGVLVVGTGEVTGIDGMTSEPAKYLLQSGDYITAVNDMEIRDKEELMERLNEIGERSITFTIRRNQEMIRVRMHTVETAAGEYKLGIWVRDNTQGIGTLTFLRDNGEFGALGHGVNDVDTSNIMEVYNGTLYDTKILSITKGEKGDPGELTGVIDYKEDNILGKIDINSQGGIFGVGNEKLSNKVFYRKLPIGLKQDMKRGDASILCSVDGETKEYKIWIEQVDYTPQSINKGIIFYVTDPDLLAKTGGIVQGLSGSPILQNGKIIGAVTHVFIQDPTKGFGIFIESMLEQSE